MSFTRNHSEYRRIVAKVDELIGMLDALEAIPTTARGTTEFILAATIVELNAV